MRLPFLASGPAKPPEYRPNPKAIFGQDQRITAAAAAGIPRAHFRQSQEITGKARPAAAFRQDQRITAQARPRAPFRQDQRITATAQANANRWPNGYLNQHEIRLRAWIATGGSAANFLLPFSEQSDAFKLAPAGEVESSDGYDIRFETSAGVKLGHVLIHYDGAAGRIIALVNMPRNFAAAESIFMYAGKPGLGSSEESAANARAGGWLAWFKGGSGTDLTGQGRNLTVDGTPGATTLLGWPAYDFDGIDDAGAQASSSYANGLSAISCVSFAQADALNQLRELYNISVDTAGELGLRYKGSDGRLVAIAKFGASVYSYESANGSQSTSPQAVAYVAAAGAPLRMAIDGAMDAPSAASGSPTGTLSISDTLEWGRGGRGSIGFWNGAAAFLALRSGAMSDAELESMTAALVDPRRVYGVGASNLVTVANRSPIAQPVFATAEAGVAKNISVVAAAYDPNGDAMTATDVTVVSGAATATVPSLTGGNVRLTGNSGVEQEVVLDFGIKDGGNKRSRGRLYATVALPEAFPRLPPSAPANKQRWIGGGGPTGSIAYTNTKAQVLQAFADAAPGDHIVFPNGTYAYDPGGTAANPDGLVIDKDGADADAWIVVRAANRFGAILGGFNGTKACGWKFTGTAPIWIEGFTGNNPQEHSPNFYKTGRNSYYNSDRAEYQFRLHGRNLRVTNCRINSPCGIGIGNSANRIDVCYNTFTMKQTPRWPQANGIYMGAFNPTSAGSNNVLIARNKWTGDEPSDTTDDDGDDGRYCVYTGNNEPQDYKTGVNRTVRFIENFVEVETIKTGWYLKRDYYHLRNFIRMGGAGNPAFNQRHGGYSNSGGTAFSDLTIDKIGLVVGCNFDRGIARFNDGPRLVVSCRMGSTTELYYGGRRTSGSTLANYTISGIPPGYTQAASDMEFVGCSFVGNMRAGEDEGTSSKPWKVWGAPEQTRWGNGEPTQGDTIKRVKVYAAGVTNPAQPTESNGKFERITNRYGETTVAAGTAGFQSLSGDNGRTALLQPYVTRAELEFTTGCDAP